MTFVRYLLLLLLSLAAAIMFHRQQTPCACAWMLLSVEVLVETSAVVMAKTYATLLQRAARMVLFVPASCC